MKQYESLFVVRSRRPAVAKLMFPWTQRWTKWHTPRRLLVRQVRLFVSSMHLGLILGIV